MRAEEPKRLLVIQAAGLGYELLRRWNRLHWQDLTFQPARTVFPAVTCTVQASFRTGLLPAAHGMVANGLWDSRYARARFWEQSAALVDGPRIWHAARRNGRSVALLFWQQSLGEAADIVLSPAPIHKHHGGLIQDCYSRPASLYADLCRTVRRPFDLRHYWGPLASHRSSQWITEATAALLSHPELAPDLCFTYLPVLDYDLQRFGPGHARSRRALQRLFKQLDLLKACTDTCGYELLVFGDYALAEVTGGPVFPNRILRTRGLLNVRHVHGRAYLDPYTSPAFAVADHETAHVHLRRTEDLARVRAALEGTPGIARVCDAAAQAELGVNHSNAGALTLLAEPGSWIAYPWWDDPAEEPDYAAHVDIHNKPGYDPAELFWGWPPGSVSRNPSRVRGTHGRTDPGREIAWAATYEQEDIDTLLDLAHAVSNWFE